MTIQQLLDMPIGTKTGGGFALTIKHTHKPREIKGGWLFEETMTDETGDILADFFVEKYNPFVRGQEIKIIVCEIQSSTKGIGKKLYVDQWEKVLYNLDDLSDYEARIPKPQQNGPDWEVINRGKVKHGLTCAYIQALRTQPTKADRKSIAKLADWVMSEKDIYNE